MTALELEQSNSHIFEGLPARCLWCSTPDGQNMFPELAFLHKCLKCGRCILACPNGAITRSSEGEIVTSYDRCRACGKCVEVCMSGARKIVGKEMTVKEVVEEIKKDALFYSNSEGGVTLSGGDPIMQPEFSATILKICKEEGIHTCLKPLLTEIGKI